jgi:DNA-binding MarR family transcriptional regulator
VFESDRTVSNPAGDKNGFIEDIMVLLSGVTDKFEPGENEMKQWMIHNFHDPHIVALLPDITLAMWRVLDAIGRLEPVNGITIAEQFAIPKGTVSKVTRRLQALKLITQESLPNNKKEILFRTTPLGKELFHAHRAFDDQMEQSLVQFLQRYSDDEKRFIVRVLQDVLDTSFLNLDLHPDPTHQK